MVLFKIFQEILLPSVFIFVLLLLGLVLILKKRKIGKVFLILGLILYYLFSITPIADLILRPLENKYQPIQEDELGKVNKSPTFGEKVGDKIVFLLGNPESTILRASEVLRIYNKQLAINNQQLNIIISGTSALNPEKGPAKEVKDYLSERGIPAKNIILEEKSRNTFESAKNVKEIIGSEPFFLVTSAYHLPRVIESFKEMGTDPIPAPTDFKIISDYNILSFFPSAKNLEKSNLTFHEYFGILFYRLYYY